MLSRARSSLAANSGCPHGGLTPPARHRLRGGFTLLEMVLALTVIVAIAAITVPVVQRAYDDYDIKEAAEQMRVQLGRARIEAIDSGLTYQFRFEPGGRRYVLLPYEQEFAPATGYAATGNSSTAMLFKDSGSLAEGLAFYSLDPEFSGVETVPQDLFEGLPDAQLLAGISWSLPLLFFPDGTAQHGGLLLTDQKGHSIPIGIRSLTGSPVIGPIERGPQQ